MTDSEKGETTGMSKGLKVLSATQMDIDAATISAARLEAGWAWHYGTVSGLGYFTTAGGKEVVIQWDEGGASRMQGGISEAQWEILRLAFQGSGRISVISDRADWKFDYRFLEAQRR